MHLKEFIALFDGGGFVKLDIKHLIIQKSDCVS